MLEASCTEATALRYITCTHTQLNHSCSLDINRNAQTIVVISQLAGSPCRTSSGQRVLISQATMRVGRQREKSVRWSQQQELRNKKTELNGHNKRCLSKIEPPFGVSLLDALAISTGSIPLTSA